MYRAALLAVVACTGTIDGDEIVDDGPLPQDDVADEPDDNAPDSPSPPPDSIDGVPVFQLPFPCGQVWTGQTRTNHSPAPSVDFNRTDDVDDPVVAAAKGVVTRVENLGDASYGRWIEIDHGGGYRTRYAHLATQTVTVNQAVLRGQQVGTLGNTGGSSGPHLHYEQRKNGVAMQATFDGVTATYYGSRSYTSANACE